jgi:ferric-chelate reductase
MVGYYVWPSVLMWGVDRLLRAARTLVFNFGYFSIKRAATLDANVEVLSPDFLRIKLRRPDHIHWTPGQCAYLTIPGLSTLDAHPFTISTIDMPPPSKTSTMHFDKEASYESLDHLDESKQLTFLVRVHKCFTKLVRNATHDDESMKIFFDGPYGEPPLLKGFETVVLIAGTSSIQH